MKGQGKHSKDGGKEFKAPMYKDTIEQQLQKRTAIASDELKSTLIALPIEIADPSAPNAHL